MLEIAAPPVTILSVQFVTAAPVFTIVTLSQKPAPQSLVVVKVAVTDPEVAADTGCSTLESSRAESGEQAPTRIPAMTELQNRPMTRFMVTCSILVWIRPDARNDTNVRRAVVLVWLRFLDPAVRARKDPFAR
jgi:hypothetical protein